MRGTQWDSGRTRADHVRHHGAGMRQTLAQKGVFRASTARSISPFHPTPPRFGLRWRSHRFKSGSSAAALHGLVHPPPSPCFPPGGAADSLRETNDFHVQTTAADPIASASGALPGRETGAAAVPAIRWLARYLRPQRGRFLLISALTLATSGLAVLTPWPLKLVADHVLGRQTLPGPLARLGLEPGSGGLLLAAVLGGLGLYALSAAVEALLEIGRAHV